MIQQSLFDNSERGLFEQIISIEQLADAYRLVRANKGTSGVDGVKVEEFGARLEEELNSLSQEVSNWNYTPKPVKRVRIPKPGSTEERLLGIPCVRDRVLQQSIRMSLEKLFEPEFSPNSFGFRPNRGQQNAIAQAQQFVKEGKTWIVDIDLEKFFDTINQDRLLYLLKRKVDDSRVLRLVGLTLRSGVMDNDLFEKSSKGAVQGSPLSPLLSNIVLDELDKELEKRGLSFCRFADDSNIFVGSEKAANRVMTSISKYIEKRLKLKVNQKKSKVAQAHEVKFLGLTIINGLVVISAKSMKHAMEKVKELTPRGTHLPIERQIEKINQWYTGWVAYYKMTQVPAQLRNIEAHMRRRLRAQFVGAQKRKRHLYRKLIKMGVKRTTAAKIFDSKHGRWRLSRTPAAHKAWNNTWFAGKGVKTFSDANLPHWQPLSVWIKIT